MSTARSRRIQLERLREKAYAKIDDVRLGRRLLRYFRPCLSTAVLAIAITLVLDLLRLLEPKFTQYAIDWYIIPRDFNGLKWLAVLFVVLRVLIFLLFYLQPLAIESIAQRVIYDIRCQLFEKIQRQDLAFFDRTPLGSLLTNVIADVNWLYQIPAAAANGVLSHVVMIVLALACMCWIDFGLTFIMLLTVPFLLMATGWAQKHTRAGYEQVHDKRSSLNSFLQEYVSGIQTVQIFNHEHEASQKFKRANDSLCDKTKSTDFCEAIVTPLTSVLASAGVACVIWYGGLSILHPNPQRNSLTVGALVAFIQYTQQLLHSVRTILGSYGEFNTALVAASRIFKLLDAPISIQSPALPSKRGRARGAIEFKHVWFAYNDQDWVLKDVSFKLEPGSAVALVGPTGAGKTTISNLLMRFYDVQRGSVLVDGVDVREWDLADLRANFASVQQDVFLFSGTIESNIRSRRQGVSNERIRWAAQEVQVDRFIQCLPKGYQTLLNEYGAGLSAGQKQLVSFARALVQDPTFLILDEATSSIDVETECLIQEAIVRLLPGRTSVFIAHRLETIRRVDRLLVLKHGEIVQDGTLKQLLTEPGFFREVVTRNAYPSPTVTG
jgi:ATP-binding cassette subfamily B multidrug efflux pump